MELLFPELLLDEEPPLEFEREPEAPLLLRVLLLGFTFGELLLPELLLLEFLLRG